VIKGFVEAVIAGILFCGVIYAAMYGCEAPVVGKSLLLAAVASLLAMMAIVIRPWESKKIE
jgi:hypothetical protein